MAVLRARHHFAVMRDAVRLLFTHRELTWEMTKREITDRYAGQVLGTLWAIGHPLVLMGVYVFIFAFVFKMRLGGSAAMPRDYTVYLLSGLVPWLAIQESMSKSAVVMIGNANLVKQVVFPIEILPVKGILASMITQAIATVILMAYTLISHHSLPWTYSLVPILWFFQFVAVAGLCYFLASVSAYFRDMKDFVQVFCIVGMYAMPIFYLPGWVPDLLRPALYANPFSYLVWCYQDVFYYGRIEHPWAWPVFIFGAVLTFYMGYRVFRKLKTHIGSVL